MKEDTVTDGPRITPPQGSRWFDIDLVTSYDRYAEAAMGDRQVDPLVFEMVRLRCAQYHDCRVCKSLRLEDALQAGLDEEIVEKIARYESSDLPDRIKVALRLTDSVIMMPTMADEALRADLAKHFTRAQVAEIIFCVIRHSVQKALVALRFESFDGGVRAMTYDEHGKAQLGDRLPSLLQC
jgi:AhpD family alkylhydroperoxidase